MSLARCSVCGHVPGPGVGPDGVVMVCHSKAFERALIFDMLHRTVVQARASGSPARGMQDLAVAARLLNLKGLVDRSAAENDRADPLDRALALALLPGGAGLGIDLLLEAGVIP